MSDKGREALQAVVDGLRTVHERCGKQGSCPWPLMWDDDVTELYEALTAGGYAVTKVGA